jgi:hypothetical protein
MIIEIAFDKLNSRRCYKYKFMRHEKDQKNDFNFK